MQIELALAFRYKQRDYLSGGDPAPDTLAPRPVIRVLDINTWIHYKNRGMTRPGLCKTMTEKNVLFSVAVFDGIVVLLKRTFCPVLLFDLTKNP